jgi:hypothetical protein
VEIAVKTVQKVAIAIALTLRRGGDDGDAVSAQRGGKASAAGCVYLVAYFGHCFLVIALLLIVYLR